MLHYRRSLVVGHHQFWFTFHKTWWILLISYFCYSQKYIQHVQPLIMLLFTTSVSLSTLYLFLSEHYFYHNSFTPTPFMQYTIMIRYGYEYGCPPSLYLLMMMVCLVFPDKSSHVGRMYVFFFWVRLYEIRLTGLWTISLFFTMQYSLVILRCKIDSLNQICECKWKDVFDSIFYIFTVTSLPLEITKNHLPNMAWCMSCYIYNRSN